MVLLVFVFTDVEDLICCSIACLASNLLSVNIGADSNVGRVGPSSSGGSNSMSSVGGDGGGNMGSVVDGGGNNIVICGQGGGNMVVGGGQGGGNMVVGGGQGGGNMGNRPGRVVDQSGVSLTLDNVLNWTVLGNIFWAKDTFEHSGVVVGVVVAGDGVATNSGDNMRSKGVNKRGGNMAVRVGSSGIGAGVRSDGIAVDQGRVSLSLTLGNDVSIVERADQRG